MALLATTGANAVDAPADVKAFTSHVARKLQQEAPNAIVAVTNDLTLSFAMPGLDEKTQINLDRIWGFCSRNRSDCDQAVANYTSGTAAAISEMARPLEPSRLRAIVRDRKYLESSQAGTMATAGKAAEVVAQPFVDDLMVVCAVDSARFTRMLRQEELGKLNLTIDAAIALCIQNVAAALRPMHEVVKKLEKKSFGYVTGDAYESSRLLLHGQWEEFAKENGGQLVVAVPGSDLIIYGRGSNRTDLDSIRAFVDHAIARAERPLSTTLFRWTRSDWQVEKR